MSVPCPVRLVTRQIKLQVDQYYLSQKWGLITFIQTKNVMGVFVVTVVVMDLIIVVVNDVVMVVIVVVVMVATVVI